MELIYNWVIDNYILIILPILSLKNNLWEDKKENRTKVHNTST